jgi:predicted DNA-binding transcriptional regulator AlpA
MMGSGEPNKESNPPRLADRPSFPGRKKGSRSAFAAPFLRREQSRMPSETAQTRRADILPASLAPIGLSREMAAAYIGIGTTLFDEMVLDSRMPSPRMINGRTVWDQEELYAAFKALPHRGVAGAVTSKTNDWSKVA